METFRHRLAALARWALLCAVAGLAVALHGMDVAVAGYNALVSGAPQATMTVQGLEAAGLSPDTAAGIDAGVSIVGMMGAGAAAKASSVQPVTHLKGRPLSKINGQKVYRVWGGASKPYGHSWTPNNPIEVPLYRSSAGLPNVNSGRFVFEATVKDATGIKVRTALPYDGNPGGLTEYLIPNPKSQLNIIRVSGANPEF